MFTYERSKKPVKKKTQNSRQKSEVNKGSAYYGLGDRIRLHALAYTWGKEADIPSGSAVAQCAPKWKSQTLENETDELLCARMIGLADFYKREYMEDGGVDFYVEKDIFENLNTEEQKYYMYGKRYQALREAGIASAIHHMVSRERLSQFYDMLDEKQKQSIADKFGKETPLGIKDSKGGSSKEILLSLRSNLVLGPAPANRSDDPAHGAGSSGSGFDPTGGDYAEISNIYRQVDQLIAEQNDMFDHVFVPQIFSLLTQAEERYKEIQRRKGMDPDMLNLDIENLWEQDKDRKWHKKVWQVI